MTLTSHEHAAVLARAQAAMRQRVVERNLNQVLRACRTMRCVMSDDERILHGAVAQALTAHDLLYYYEYELGPGSRIDFWTTPQRIGIEVKRGKPQRAALERQVARYCSSTEVDGLIMVVERCVFDHPHTVNGKPVAYLSLSKLFGIAV